MPTPDEILEYFLEEARTEADSFEVGEDISTIPELKIIFDGFAEDDNGEEDQSNESYALFIHKDALNKNFVFPKHEVSPWSLVHRPDQEIWLHAWYDTTDNYWTLPDDWNDSIDNKNLSVELFEDILTTLYKRHAS
jgi:hypothetical protein